MRFLLESFYLLYNYDVKIISSIPQQKGVFLLNILVAIKCEDLYTLVVHQPYRCQGINTKWLFSFHQNKKITGVFIFAILWYPGGHKSQGLYTGEHLCSGPSHIASLFVNIIVKHGPSRLVGIVDGAPLPRNKLMVALGGS